MGYLFEHTPTWVLWVVCVVVVVGLFIDPWLARRFPNLRRTRRRAPIERDWRYGVLAAVFFLAVGGFMVFAYFSLDHDPRYLPVATMMFGMVAIAVTNALRYRSRQA